MSAPKLCAEPDISGTIPKDSFKTVGHTGADLADRFGATHVDSTATDVVTAIAQIASAAIPDGTRPAPLYLRPADAAPPRDPAPVIL